MVFGTGAPERVETPQQRGNSQGDKNCPLAVVAQCARLYKKENPRRGKEDIASSRHDTSYGIGLRRRIVGYLYSEAVWSKKVGGLFEDHPFLFCYM